MQRLEVSFTIKWNYIWWFKNIVQRKETKSNIMHQHLFAIMSRICALNTLTRKWPFLRLTYAKVEMLLCMHSHKFQFQLLQSVNALGNRHSSLFIVNRLKYKFTHNFTINTIYCKQKYVIKINLCYRIVEWSFSKV